jgi:YD repeat-containing protein
VKRVIALLTSLTCLTVTLFPPSVAARVPLLTPTAQAGHRLHRTDDLVGRLLTLTYPNHSVATYTYNAQGGIETVRLQAPSSTPQDIVSDGKSEASRMVTPSDGR